MRQRGPTVRATGERVPAFVVAGTHSGAGKTTVTLTLLATLRAAGYCVQPFKIGPDFIDAGHHGAVAGRDSINLDSWMMGMAGVRRSFVENAAGCDVAVVESMGALFDGENGVRDRGSAAHLARALSIPVVLVVDIWGMTRSTAALLDGFLRFDPRTRIAGVLFNRAGSRAHYEMMMAGLPPRLRRLSLGWLRRDSGLEIPERHLGVLTVEESGISPEERAARLVSAGENLDMDALRRILGLGPPESAREVSSSSPIARQAARKRPPLARIGVARDRAFCFYYSENLRLLQAAGAELHFFSPVEGTVPDEVDGVYLGGGYPESFAAELEANETARRALAERARAGMPVYAECGGLMYLGRSITGFDGRSHAMASILPLDTRMDPAFLAIRYVKVRTRWPSLLGPAGTVARGQEFHQSRIVRSDGGEPFYALETSRGEHGEEGFTVGNVVGSYVHLHFRSNPSIPRAFVQACHAARLASA
jgi:cobyrinic acid a,c-diamide synthase